jgi:hypothetical protein
VGVILLRDGVDASEYLYYVTQLLVDIIWLDEQNIFVEITQYIVSHLAEL